MDEILRQLVPLVIGSVPTMILFLVLVIAYKFLLHGPLLKILAERRARTEGAVERAHAAIAAADAKAQEYEAKLRAARAEIFRARENRIKAWNAERESALATARQAARDRVNAAKSSLEAQAATSRQEFERGADALVADILKAVLSGGSLPGNPVAAEESH
ncbi:ATP synthase F0 sector subunit b' [Acidisarcina polymorpha]|uniref:ATP synthase F0 sector subunit b n=1 Tax=Acidisarcina polymorpha TaxID=2211140 RepID=A0A2Z5FX08_9BACT|nr:ATP synthase F0 subunit B [Acidisarcina polymorpha]AXC11371.1 ATP synthase F0 sector subunit b' [Acidisarcina polymorpha]